MSESDEWYYPKLEYIKLCKKYKINPKLDVAATNKYHLCQYYFTKKDDALKQEWLIKAGTKKTGAWVNPPLRKGMTKAFILKAHEQWSRHNINILMIVPAGVISRQYFQPIWKLFKDGMIELDPISPRPRFLFKGEKTKYSARNDYISLFFKKRNAI